LLIIAKLFAEFHKIFKGESRRVKRGRTMAEKRKAVEMERECPQDPRWLMALYRIFPRRVWETSKLANLERCFLGEAKASLESSIRSSEEEHSVKSTGEGKTQTEPKVEATSN
jgi:hypothetical protein